MYILRYSKFKSDAYGNYGTTCPCAAFVPPETDIRDALTREAVKQLVENAQKTQTKNRVADIVNEKSIVNAMIGLLATGGSTNHTIHLPAIARAAGIHINWNDFMIYHKLCHLFVKSTQTVKPI